MKWLVGESDFQGSLSSEEDVKIQHSQKEDVLWFYSTITGVPGLVLLFGMIATRSRRRRSGGQRHAA